MAKVSVTLYVSSRCPHCEALYRLLHKNMDMFSDVDFHVVHVEWSDRAYISGMGKKTIGIRIPGFEKKTVLPAQKIVNAKNLGLPKEYDEVLNYAFSGAVPQIVVETVTSSGKVARTVLVGGVPASAENVFIRNFRALIEFFDQL